MPARHAQVPLDAVFGGVPRKRFVDVLDHAATLFYSLVLRPKADTKAARLAQALAGQQYGVIRAKGFIQDQDGRYMLLQVVGSRWQLAAVSDGSAAHCDCAIICIGLRGRLDKNGLMRLYS